MDRHKESNIYSSPHTNTSTWFPSLNVYKVIFICPYAMVNYCIFVIFMKRFVLSLKTLIPQKCLMVSQHIPHGYLLVNSVFASTVHSLGRIWSAFQSPAIWTYYMVYLQHITLQTNYMYTCQRIKLLWENT